MGKTQRIKTEIGINKQINVELEQDFDFLEILSLTIQQQDVYTKSCADYGVVVGRVTANNGYGIPNTRVSVFIPIENIDKFDPTIFSIYPYTNTDEKNEDGYRYNLLPYEQSHSGHIPTGTFPSRDDVMVDKTAIEIYDKYYKYTVKTNDSGDFLIMGVPLGVQEVFVDMDLSDIGEFSLTPQDLIRMGRATEAQVAGSRFKSSTDLNSLPQIVSLKKSIDVAPLWGDPDICQIAISRVDFDLRDDANINIEPTAVFMGSMFSSPDKFRIRRKCKPRDNMGNLCGLVASPGQILALRQTIAFDTSGRPILEEYQLEKSGNVIDDSGSWIVEVPMNLDYVITNEFGDKVISNDPTIGIPTKSKYRFKVKWRQPPTLTEQTRRAYFLVPNIREYGWDSSGSLDPSTLPITDSRAKRQTSSYYFGLDWSGYTNGFAGQQEIDRTNDIIDCEDTFYEMYYNRVYTVSGLIDQWKKGGKGRFIGIKEIDDDACDSTVNKFPTNEGFRNFDLLFFLFSILITLLTPVIIAVLVVAHIILFLYEVIIKFLCTLCQIKILWVRPFGWVCNSLGIDCPYKKDFTFRIPMITYPDCDTCECKQDLKDSRTELPQPSNAVGNGALTFLSIPETYLTPLEAYYSASTDPTIIATIVAEAIGGRASTSVLNDSNQYKLPQSQRIQAQSSTDFFAASKNLPLGERINLFNNRKKYFDNINKIKVQVEPDLNQTFHYDNTITVLSNTPFNAGDLVTTVNLSKSKDLNWLYSANTPSGVVTGISGVPYTTTAATPISITYATSRSQSQTVIYNLPFGTDERNYKFPADIEYFQVVTAITWNSIITKWNKNTLESFPNILYEQTQVNGWLKNSVLPVFTCTYLDTFIPIDYVSDIDKQYVLVLQRGVDPYSPKYTQKYHLGNLFGTNENDTNFIFTASTRLNIPIQIDNNTSLSILTYNQNSIFYQSYFFNPGIPSSNQPGLTFSSYTTTNTGYYGLQDVLNFNNTYFRRNSSDVVTRTSNGFYRRNKSGANYDILEDVFGLGAMGCIDYLNGLNDIVTSFGFTYYSKTIYGSNNPTVAININTKNVLRTDRLPSSDTLDGGDWGNNPAILQQNLNFSLYLINSAEEVSSSPVTLGASTPENDVDGLPNVSVLSSFDCQNMVSLNCYQGFGTQFQINQNCVESDAVERGCYMFMRKPLKDLVKDLKTFSEWSYRFRFFYGLCRGILSQSFTNNWVNGALYAFPIQVDTFYDKFNKPFSRYCKEIVFFDSQTTNFYYRSSPFYDVNNKFVGKLGSDDKSVNTKNLLFPTTIVNLGMKDSFYNEISFEPSTQSYILKNLDSTSYGDTGDLINLFVISRITDASFLQQLFSTGDNSINQLFTRYEKRIDGDLAQLMSINSEVGVIKFSPEYYEVDPNNQYNPTNILGTAGDPTIAVWFSSTTENLQLRDFITPGRINFRGTPTSNFAPYQYGIKSQTVPFYRWNLNTTSRIFGNQYNNWLTDRNDILSTKYQSLDRMKLLLPTYFQSATSPQTTDLYNRGYIFSVDANGNYSELAPLNPSFIVGAPFHFYFGTVKGDSALDKFKTKYSIDE